MENINFYFDLIQKIIMIINDIVNIILNALIIKITLQKWHSVKSDKK